MKWLFEVKSKSAVAVAKAASEAPRSAFAKSMVSEKSINYINFKSGPYISGAKYEP